MRNGRKVETQEIMRPMFISRILEWMHAEVVRGKLVVCREMQWWEEVGRGGGYVYNYLNTKYRAFAALAWTTATYRTTATAEVLVKIILVSEIVIRSNEVELRGWLRAYMAPVMNIRDMPIFSFRESCSRQIIGRGKIKMIRSEMKFIEPYANPALV